MTRDAKKKPRPEVHTTKPSRHARFDHFSALLERHWTAVLLVLGAVALGLRTGLALAIWHLPHGFLLNADIEHYHTQALIRSGLLEGNVERVFALSPLSTMWGTFWHWITGSTSVWVVVAPQLLVGTGTVLLTAAIGRRVAGPGVGLIAGVLIALYKSIVLFDVAILSESLAIFLGTALLWSCLYTAQRPNLKRVIILGLIMGVGASCRPNHLVLAPIALVLVLYAARPLPWWRHALLAAVLTLSTILPIAPVTIANYVRGGVFVPVTWVAGLNLYFGNYHQSQGRLMPSFDVTRAADGFILFTHLAQKAQGRTLNEAEVSRFWKEQTIRDIAYDPAHFRKNLWRKFIFSLNATENPDSWSQEFLVVIIPSLALACVGFGWVFPFGVLGLLVLWRRGPPGTRILHGMVLMSLFTMVAFFVTSRFRGPMAPCLAVGTAAALVFGLEELRRLRAAGLRSMRRRLMLASAVVLSALLALFCHKHVLEAVMDDQVLYLSRELALEDRHEDAVRLLEKVATYARRQDETALLATTEDALKRHREMIAGGLTARHDLQSFLKAQPPPVVSYDYELFLPGINDKKKAE